jgi:hypothetical protein
MMTSNGNKRPNHASKGLRRIWLNPLCWLVQTIPKNSSFSPFPPRKLLLLCCYKRKNKGMKNPFPSFSKAIRDAKIKYDILEKQSYTLVKSLKAFKVYVLQSIIISYVPSNNVKGILVQTNSEGKTGKCIFKLLEYDLHINPTKLIKEKGLARLLSYSNCKALELHHTFIQSDASMMQVGKENMHVFDH